MKKISHLIAITFCAVVLTLFFLIQILSKNSGTAEEVIVDQIVKITGKVDKKALPDPDNSESWEQNQRPFIVFTIMGEQSHQLLTLGEEVFTDQNGEFKAEYIYKKPCSRKDTLIVIFYFWRGFISDSVIMYPTRDFRDLYNPHFSGHFAIPYKIQSNPFVVETDFAEILTGNLNLYLNFTDPPFPATNFPYEIFANAVGHELNWEHTPHSSYVRFQGTLKTAADPIKIKLPTGVQFLIQVSVYNLYKGWATKVLLTGNETTHLNVVLQKPNPNFIGRCIDETGRPLSDVSIIVTQHGVSNTAKSSHDGTFKIDIDEKSEIDHLRAGGGVYSIEALKTDPSALKSLVLKKYHKGYNITLDLPDKYKKIISTTKSKIRSISGTITKEQVVHSPPDHNKLVIHCLFTLGKNTLVFKQFDDISLEWIPYHKEILEITESTPTEFSITIPDK
ncbi:MAG: hypothetical protein HY606_01390 [Planctomycetes bacterium]|nr:hypothetical protein [Planctomycetota bacterium]